MLKSQGYPETQGALAFVAKHLKVPAMTLSRWFRAANNPPPNELVTEKKADLRTLYENEIYAIMKVLPDKRDEASYGTLASAQGIFFDKIRLLDGLPTAITEILPGMAKAYEKHGERASEAFERLIQRMLVDD